MGFRIGDLVKLKSGGPTMTVNNIATAHHVDTAWFSGSKQEMARFHEDALVLAPPEDAKKK